MRFWGSLPQLGGESMSGSADWIVAGPSTNGDANLNLYGGAAREISNSVTHFR